MLALAAADRAHRAFSNLFVQTEFDPVAEILLAGRRPRAEGEVAAWAAHLTVVEGNAIGTGEFETDRARFLGRDRTLALPQALTDRAALHGSTGTVLDPVFSLRRRLRIGPRETARITFWTAVASSRDEVMRIADKCRDAAAFDRASTLAWTSARVQLHHLGVDPEEAILFQRLAAHIFYLNPALRPSPDLLRRNRTDVHALWAHGVSGDRPIMVVEVDDVTDLALVRQLLRAHGYFTLKHLPVDLVIVNESSTSYLQDVQDSIESLARASQQRVQHRMQLGLGMVYALRAGLMSPEARLALLAAARVSLVSRRGTLAEQLDRLEDPSAEASAVLSRRSPPAERAVPKVGPVLELANGIGGFDRDGREYVIVLKQGSTTPMPWINVIAQPGFGFPAPLLLAVASPGHATAARTRLRSGPTMRSPIRPPRRSMCATMTPACCGARQLHQFEIRRVCTSHAMAKAIQFFSTRPMDLNSSCCNSCRAARRLRYRSSRSAIRGLVHGT